MSRVSLVGGTPAQARSRALAWRRSGFEVAHTADVLDLLEPDFPLTLAALRRGDSVLTEPPIGPELAAAARASVGILGVVQPWLHYPPALRLADRLDARVIGKLSMGRCRSFGLDLDELVGAIHDKAALLARFLGPIVEVCARSTGTEPPCTTLLSFRHAGRARFSSVELTLAPGAPRDDDLELVGSAGVAWLRGGPGLPRCPALEFHLGGRLRPEPAEATWQDAVDRCVSDFAASLRAACQPDLALPLHASAVVPVALACAVHGHPQSVPGSSVTDSRRSRRARVRRAGDTEMRDPS